LTAEPIRVQEILQVLRKRARLVGVIILAGGLAAAALSFTLKPWYSSRALFSVDAPPSPAGSSPGVLGLASQLGFGGLIGTGGYGAQYYANVLQSNRVLDVVALEPVQVDSAGRSDRLFAKAPAATPLERDRARRQLAKHFGTSVDSRTNTIIFSIEGPTPFAAKAAADSVVASMDRAVIAQRQQRASMERQFLEERLDSALFRQNIAEGALRRFYVQNRIATAPDLRFEEARLKRAADFAVELATQLRSQLEQARLQEVRDNPAVTVISAPEIPGRRSRPNRRFIVLATMAVIACFSLAWAAIEVAMARNGSLAQG
jgi:uncharacterized protein involved in exopolysaccharide biosynthesis